MLRELIDRALGGIAYLITIIGGGISGWYVWPPVTSWILEWFFHQSLPHKWFGIVALIGAFASIAHFLRYYEYYFSVLQHLKKIHILMYGKRYGSTFSETLHSYSDLAFILTYIAADGLIPIVFTVAFVSLTHSVLMAAIPAWEPWLTILASVFFVIDFSWNLGQGFVQALFHNARLQWETDPFNKRK